MSLSVEELARPIIESHGATERLDLRMGACRIRVESNSPELIVGLRRYFRHWTDAPQAAESDVIVTALEADLPVLMVPFVDWPRDPGKVGKKDEYADIEGGRAVRKVRTGMQYLLGPGRKLLFGPCLQHPNQVVNFIIAQYITWLLHRGFVLCHAAGVVQGQQGLALAGVAGAGKSTLALHLLTRGLSFASNDRVLIGAQRERVLMAGVPKQPRINPGTGLSISALESIVPAHRRAALSTLPRDELWKLEEKYDVDVGRVFGDDRWALEASLAGVVVLTWRHDVRAPTEVSRVSLGERRDLLDAIVKAPGPFFELPGGQPPRGVHAIAPEQYLEHLSGVPVYEVTGRVDFEAAVRACLELLS